MYCTPTRHASVLYVWWEKEPRDMGEGEWKKIKQKIKKGGKTGRGNKTTHKNINISERPRLNQQYEPPCVNLYMFIKYTF